MVSPQILFGIGAMLLWALADIFAIFAIKRAGNRSALMYSQGVSAALSILLFLVLRPEFSLSHGEFFLFLLCACLNGAGFFFFYRAIETDKASLAFPLAYSWSVIAALLSIVFLGERPAPLVFAGALLVFFGGVFSELKEGGLKKAALSLSNSQVFLSAILWGIAYAIFTPLEKVAGAIPSTFLLRTLSFPAILLLLFVVFPKKSLQIPQKRLLLPNAYLLFLGVGLFELLAALSYTFGIHSGETSIVAPLSAGAPALIVIFSIFALKERLSKSQLAGISMVLLGTFLASLASALQ